jgi:hypothetical protein
VCVLEGDHSKTGSDRESFLAGARDTWSTRVVVSRFPAIEAVFPALARHEMFLPADAGDIIPD